MSTQIINLASSLPSRSFLKIFKKFWWYREHAKLIFKQSRKEIKASLTLIPQITTKGFEIIYFQSLLWANQSQRCQDTEKRSCQAGSSRQQKSKAQNRATPAPAPAPNTNRIARNLAPKWNQAGGQAFFYPMCSWSENHGMLCMNHFDWVHSSSALIFWDGPQSGCWGELVALAESISKLVCHGPIS